MHFFVCFLFIRVEFPPCVQWITVEFDHQCGTAQPEDCLLVSIPTVPVPSTVNWSDTTAEMVGSTTSSRTEQKFNICKNACITSCVSLKDDDNYRVYESEDDDRFVVKIFNT